MIDIYNTIDVFKMEHRKERLSGSRLIGLVKDRAVKMSMLIHKDGEQIENTGACKTHIGHIEKF